MFSGHPVPKPAQEPSESEGEDVSAAQEAEAEEPPDAAAEVRCTGADPQRFQVSWCYPFKFV